MSEKGTKTDLKNDCHCYSELQYRKACPPIRNVTHPLRYYEFTQEELRALEECDRESFYKRCLPFSATLATATYAAIKCGYLKRHPHFGAVPKVLLAVVAGHAAGRVSHSPVCDALLRERLPENSRLGSLLRNYHVQTDLSNKDPKP